MSEKIMVSVCCLVYNHERYLKKCLDGFVMQKTKFRFEVLIHDDASADNSAQIIREYEKNYPDIIKPIYQTENQYSKGVDILWTNLFPKAQGKYIALCEGDDFWTNPDKLQKQFERLEASPDCVLCTHIVQCITENGDATEQVYPPTETEDILSSDNWMKLISEYGYLFQTSSYFFRTEIAVNYFGNLPEFIRISPVGDEVLIMLLLSEGNCSFIREKMSCYRMNSIGSWNMTQKNTDNRIKHLEKFIAVLHSFDNYSDYRYHEYIQNRILKFEFELHLLHNDFRACLQKKYRSFLPLRTKISFTVYSFFPKLRTIYMKIRYKNES